MGTQKEYNSKVVFFIKTYLAILHRIVVFLFSSLPGVCTSFFPFVHNDERTKTKYFHLLIKLKFNSMQQM